MRAVVWHGKRDVRVDEVPDPVIQDPGDAVIRVTSTNICGSDLHLYEVLGAFMHEGDVLGHETMGVVEEVGAGVTAISPGDRSKSANALLIKSYRQAEAGQLGAVPTEGLQ